MISLQGCVDHAQGYRRFGALCGGASTTGRERRQGLEKALREHELTPVTMRYLPPRIDAAMKQRRRS